MLYDRGRTDSFDVPAGSGLGYLHNGSISRTGLCSFLLLIKIKKQKNQDDKLPGFCVCRTYALSTFPDFRQEAHTYNFFGVPFTLQLTRLMFDFHMRLDFLLEWLTLFPK